MLHGLSRTALYLLKACVMLNMVQTSGALLTAGFASCKEALFSLALVLLVVVLLVVGLVFEDTVRMTYSSLLAVFLPVVLLDQLGLIYFYHRLKFVRKTYSSEERMEYIA